MQVIRKGYFTIQEDSLTIFEMTARRLASGSWHYSDQYGEAVHHSTNLALEVAALANDAERLGVFRHVTKLLVDARMAGRLFQERTIGMEHFGSASFRSSCFFDLPPVLFETCVYPVRVAQLTMARFALTDEHGYRYAIR